MQHRPPESRRGECRRRCNPFLYCFRARMNGESLNKILRKFSHSTDSRKAGEQWVSVIQLKGERHSMAAKLRVRACGVMATLHRFGTCRFYAPFLKWRAC
nr:hypothetical protein Iba_chr04cCG1100 [Ipomoea batatas]